MFPIGYVPVKVIVAAISQLHAQGITVTFRRFFYAEVMTWFEVMLARQLTLPDVFITPESESKRDHIDIMCVDPTSDGRRIDAHDVNMMSF